MIKNCSSERCRPHKIIIQLHIVLAKKYCYGVSFVLGFSGGIELHTYMHIYICVCVCVCGTNITISKKKR